jgi:protein involved in polysaccharide export with SLBB domain
MRKQLVLGVGLLFAMYSVCAPAQVSPVGGTSPASNSSDCSDPASANSPDCSASQYQNGQIGVGSNPASGRSTGANGLGQDNTRTQNFTDIGGVGNQTGNRNGVNRTLLPPEPLTEFQKFVAGTTGQILPVFGASLFQNAPSTFAPLDQTPVPPDYLIGPGDELRIRVWGQVNFNADLRVDRSGEIYLPQVGQVHVAGIPIQALNEHLKTAVGRIFRNFDLTADIGQIRAVQVYVVGQAHRPGTYTISSLSTLVDALFASGGPSVLGSMRHILLKRNGKTVADFDIYDLLVKGDKSQDAALQSGDVIFIPAVGPQVAFTGSVRRPGIYELRGDQTVDQLLTIAGGATAVAEGARVSIERIVERQHRVTMEVSLDAEGLATQVHDGDMLRILSIVPSYQKTVTLRGNTANPGRFAWHEGMRVADLIPDRDSLLTRDYWWKRTQLGLPAPEFEPVPSLSALSQPNYPVDLRARPEYPRNAFNCIPLNTNSSTNLNSNFGPNSNSNANSASSQSPLRCVPSGNGNSVGSNYDLSGQQYGVSGQNSYDGNFAGGNLPQDLASQRQTQQQGLTPLTASQRAASATLAGRQNQVVTQNTASATQHTTVTLSAPEIDWNYAVIERLDPQTLKTSLLSFDLGKLVMGHDQDQNLVLQPGDVVSVFSQADIHVPMAEQTKFVRLEGEFIHAGTYSVLPGETLPQLVARAGGFTHDAYLYGSEFTRESARVTQQQRIDEYVQTLQLQILRGTLAQSSSAVSSAQDIASANSAVTTERDLISKLELIRATGRLVLEVKPDTTGMASLPDLALEDGDSFTVPSVPANVNVVGAVYDQNSFIYATGRRVGDYLHLAGGPNRDADKKHIFVIRADGSVLSREANNGIWGNTFDAAQMNPGDTLVVPEKTFRPSAMRGFLEWSQLFSQLAFGIAAISVIQ